MEELIGRDTINTMPPATMKAFRDHGRLRATVDTDIEGAHRVMHDLSRAGISLEAVTDRLLEDGIAQFSRSFDTLLAGLGKKAGDRRPK